MNTWCLHTDLCTQRAHQGNWQPQRNRNFRELLWDWVEHAQIEETASQIAEDSATEQASLLTVALPRSVPVSAVLTNSCDSRASLDCMTVEAANFVFVQLIEQKPGIYDKCHADYARRNKIYLAWEKISHEMKQSGSWWSSFEQYKHFSLNWHGRTDAPNLFFS
jgi:hypothetical protein